MELGNAANYKNWPGIYRYCKNRLPYLELCKWCIVVHQWQKWNHEIHRKHSVSRGWYLLCYISQKWNLHLSAQFSAMWLQVINLNGSLPALPTFHSGSTCFCFFFRVLDFEGVSWFSWTKALSYILDWKLNLLVVRPPSTVRILNFENSKTPDVLVNQKSERVLAPSSHTAQVRKYFIVNHTQKKNWGY